MKKTVEERRSETTYLACLASELDKLAVIFDNATLVEPLCRMFLDFFGRLSQSESGEYSKQREAYHRFTLGELDMRLRQTECHYSFGNWL